jgi:hypothetical protein
MNQSANAWCPLSANAYRAGRSLSTKRRSACGGQPPLRGMSGDVRWRIEKRSASY